MQQSKPPALAEAERAEFEQQLRVNIAFDHAAVAVLVGSGLGGFLAFLLVFAISIGAGVSVLSAFIGAVFSALTLAVLIFFIGFLAGLVLITPLYRALEKAKRREPWPYFIAATLIGATGLLITAGLPFATRPGPAAIVAVGSASLAAAFMFTRSIKPLWAAAIRAEEEAAARREGVILRLH